VLAGRAALMRKISLFAVMIAMLLAFAAAAQAQPAKW
jgi:hypothetical protein